MKIYGRLPVIVLVAMLLLSIPVSFIVIEWPINSLPEQIMLDVDDLPDGWEQRYSGITYGVSDSRWVSCVYFHNENNSIGSGIELEVGSFCSECLATKIFSRALNDINIELNLSSWKYNDIRHIDIGDECVRVTWLDESSTPETFYLLRVKNILIAVGFQTSHDGYPYESWMDDIVRKQEIKIR